MHEVPSGNSPRAFPSTFKLNMLKKKANISHIKHCLYPPFHLLKHFHFEITVESFTKRSSTPFTSFPQW